MAVAGGPRAYASWVATASRIEAYREEWGILPESLGERPMDRLQAGHWDAAVRMPEILARPPVPAVERGLDRGIDLGL
jgi:hypothetical protein